MIATAVASGLGYFAFWWVLIPAFFAGSLSLSNGPHYANVVQANQRGSMTFFPMMLTIYCTSQMIIAGLAYWAAKTLG
jgi:hypothetical protein